MMLVHVWPGAGRIQAADVGPVLDGFYTVMLDFLARGSVPLLSIISGFLFWRRMQSRPGYGDVVSDKVRTLIIPMVAWSAAMLALRLLDAAAHGETNGIPNSALGWINAVFALTEAPANLPLAFLRDIFVCCVAVGAVAHLVRTTSIALAVIVAWAVAELVTDGLLVLRPQIAVFFAAGYLVGSMRGHIVEIRWPVLIAAFGVDILARSVAADSAPTVWQGEVISLFHRATVAMAFWSVALTIARTASQGVKYLTNLEPLIFVTFCTHMITVSVIAYLIAPTHLQVTSQIYPLLFVAQIPVIYVMASTYDRIGRRLMPDLWAAVTANRKARRPRIPGGPDIIPAGTTTAGGRTFVVSSDTSSQG